MSVMGDKYSVELERKNTHGAEWIFLKLTDPTGRVRGCRWHTDASDREIAFALRALSDDLDPGRPRSSNFNPRCAEIEILSAREQKAKARVSPGFLHCASGSLAGR